MPFEMSHFTNYSVRKKKEEEKNPQQIKTKRKSVTSSGVIGQKRDHTVRLRAYRKLSV